MDAKQHAEQIEHDGYTVVENAIDSDFIDSLHDDVLRLEKNLGSVPAKNPFEGANTVRIYNLLIHGELYTRVALQENILNIVEKVLDRGCLISSLSSIAIQSGESKQPLHADDQLIPIPRPHVPLVCNCMWAITDFTEDNGATRIVPGSHKWDKAPHSGAKYEAIQAVMPKGSVMVYNGSLWHGGGANTSDERRIGIAMNYCAGYIRQQENQQLGIPPDVVKTFPKRLQEMVGYSIYAGIIGHIAKSHPRRLLDDA